MFRKYFFVSNFFKKLPLDLRAALLWCSLCGWFNASILREVLVSEESKIELDQELWHWLIDLKIIKKLSTSAEDFYQVRNPYRTWIQRYCLDRQSAQQILAQKAEKLANNAVDPQHFSLYKAEKLIHEVQLSSRGLTDDSVIETLSLFRYEPNVRQFILSEISKKLNNRRVSRIYRVASSLPSRNNIEAVIIFPITLLIEKISIKLKPHKLSIFPLYVASLVYQTWSDNERAINTLDLTLSRIPDNNRKLQGTVLSRIALSNILVGKMDVARKSLIRADNILNKDSDEWLDNQLNMQIWYLKRGYWQESLQVGLPLVEVIRNPYLEAKHIHILGVTYLYLGDLSKARQAAIRCEELSSLVTLSSWIIGKAWRNRFAYSLLSTISLLEGTMQSVLEDKEKYYNKSLEISRDVVKQLPPLLRYMIEHFLIYIEAYISALRGDFDVAEQKFIQLQHDKYLESYYRVSSQMNLATIYLRTNRRDQAISLYKYSIHKASRFGFKYLEKRALNHLYRITLDESLIEKISIVINDDREIGGSYMDNLAFLPPV